MLSNANNSTLCVHFLYSSFPLSTLSRECHYLDTLCAGSEEFTGVAVRGDVLVEEEGF